MALAAIRSTRSHRPLAATPLGALLNWASANDPLNRGNRHEGEVLETRPDMVGRLSTRYAKLTSEYPTDRELTMPPAIYAEWLLLGLYAREGASLCQNHAAKAAKLVVGSAPFERGWEAVRTLMAQGPDQA